MINNANHHLQGVEWLLPEEENKFEPLEYEEIEHSSSKAVLIDGDWFPISQLRIHAERNELWVSKWLMRQRGMH